ncbi:glycosyl hydrolase [Modestobacter sp. SSW1-42]|uniref:glycosyl hydrolase n=1 Tax=Modestobacter sp. SSW1-42 TaxID=596372 RepID=UPI00398804FB
MGWSADPVAGQQQAIIGTWMDRKSWENLEQGQWLADNPTFVQYVADNPEGAADIGVPLVPYESGADLDDLLREAASGARDDLYRSLGAEIAESSPATVYARVWWEMNLRPLADDIDRELFKAAWVHAVPLIREGFESGARPGQTMQVVFSPNADGADYEEFYPGDEQVDLMALDAYGQRWGNDTPDAEELLSLLDEQLTRFADFARSHGKPVAMAEWGNVAVKEAGQADQMQGRGDFPPYVALVLDWAAREDAAYLIYFNSAEGGVGQTLTDTPDSLSMLQQAWTVPPS